MSWDIPYCAANELPPRVAELSGDWKGHPLELIEDPLQIPAAATLLQKVGVVVLLRDPERR